jgi:hypothetical protein
VIITSGIPALLFWQVKSALHLFPGEILFLVSISNYSVPAGKPILPPHLRIECPGWKAGLYISCSKLKMVRLKVEPTSE